MVDNFSRFNELVPIPAKSAVIVAEAFNDASICRNSTPRVILGVSLLMLYDNM